MTGKNIARAMVLSFTSLLLLPGLELEAANKEAYLDYPIRLTQKLYNRAIPPRALFHSGILRHQKKANGTIQTQVVQRKRSGDTLTYKLLLTAKKHRVAKFTIRFAVDEANKTNTMTYFKFHNLKSGKAKERRYNGSTRSLGQVWGMFMGSSQFIFDPEKLKAKLSQSGS